MASSNRFPANVRTTLDPDIGTQNNVTLNYSKGLTGVELSLNDKITQYLILSLMVVAGTVLGARICSLVLKHSRHMNCLLLDRTPQTYWAINPNWWLPWVKRELFCAPLGKKRHNREWQLSKASNCGTVPGRIHTILLVLYGVSNFIYCCMLPYNSPDTARTVAALRGRAGVLSVVNMTPLILFAGRNNPLINLLDISFDTFNLFHRWIGRICITEAIVHTIAYYYNYLIFADIDGPWRDSPNRFFYAAGLTAVVVMVIILFPSLSPVRHAFYEVFLHTHQALAAIALIGVFIHLRLHSLPSFEFICITIFVWVAERTVRLMRILRLNLSFCTGATTNCIIEALPGQACRVTFDLPHHVTIHPGSHVYAYVPRFSFWMSHPFSIAWTDTDAQPNNFTQINKSNRFRAQKKKKTTLSLLVAARTGFTRKIYDAANASPSKTLHVKGLAEGPYAGHERLASYGTIIMFAGGAGITHHLVEIRHLLACAEARTIAARNIVLAWSIRDVQAMDWVRPWIDEIMQMPMCRAMFEIKVFVTGGEIWKARLRTNIAVVSGRCQPGFVLDKVFAQDAQGTTFVSVCGPGAFADEVRAAVRQRMNARWIDMREESFTW